MSIKKAIQRLIIRKKGSKSYWETRYALGANSGPGSYGKLAEFKAEVLNGLITELNINSLIELGCGDENQTSLLNKEINYLGLDISPTIIEYTRELFSSDEKKDFMVFDSTKYKNAGVFINADMVISLDVLYHLVEVEIYESYLTTLFGMARKYVVIYASDNEEIATKDAHVCIRSFTPHIADNYREFQLIRKIENKHSFDERENNNPNDCSWSEFFIYERISP